MFQTRIHHTARFLAGAMFLPCGCLALNGCGGDPSGITSSDGGGNGGGGNGGGGGGIPTAYAITDLGVLPGGTVSQAFGVNASGQVVGQTDIASGAATVTHAFVYTGGKMIDLGLQPGGTTSRAYAINASGQIGGQSDNSVGTEQATVFHVGSTTLTDLETTFGTTVTFSELHSINTAGQMVGLTSTGNFRQAVLYTGSAKTVFSPLPGDHSSSATGINDSGLICGNSTAVVDHAVLYQPGSTTPTALGTLPGGTGSNAFAINNKGQIAGASETATGTMHAVVFQAGSSTVTDLGTLPGDTSSAAAAINSSGQVVGASSPSAQASPTTVRAFLDSGGKMIDLKTLLSAPDQAKWTLNAASGINDSGQICGDGMINGQIHAFLLTPKG